MLLDEFCHANTNLISEPIQVKGVRRIFGLFWPIFDQKIGGYILAVDIAPDFLIENRIKRTKNSTELFYLDRFLAETGFELIPKQLQESVSASVGQPQSLRYVCIAQIIQVELLRRRLRLTQILGASLAYSRFLRFFRYIP